MREIGRTRSLIGCALLLPTADWSALARRCVWCVLRSRKSRSRPVLKGEIHLFIKGRESCMFLGRALLLGEGKNPDLVGYFGFGVDFFPRVVSDSGEGNVQAKATCNEN